MIDISNVLAQAVVLLWIPLIPLRLALHGGVKLWRRFGDLFYLVAFVYWAAVDLMLMATRPLWLSSRFTAFPGAELLGWTLLVGGVALGLWAANTLGLVTFLTRPQVSPGKSRATLIVTGPYRWVRHPFYLSEWLILLGAALVSRAWIVLGILLVTFFVVPLITRWEEKDLVARFGKDYSDYQRKVPRLLPTFSHQ